MTLARVVVVGASLAGATTAITLRRLGFEGELVLLGDETHLPYERPALSKGYLSGDVDAASLLVQPASAYADLGIELRLGSGAVSLDPTGRTVTLADGASVPYDALVIATGSANVRPPIPGLQTRGVHQLRNLADADRLAAAIAAARTAVVVGMGFIGCEVAATLRGRGLAVTMVDRLSGPLVAQVGPEVSARVRAWHVAAGVQLVEGADVAAFLGTESVEGVRLADGRILPADLVVVGVGARPATEWLRDAPLHLVGGAVGVDGAGRSSLPDVYAAGDVAAVWESRAGGHRRTEHYRAAIDQGTRLAHGLLGQPVPGQTTSWFWSDQYDHVLHYAGDREDARAHVRADPYAAFFTRGSTLTAVATVDDGRGFRRALRLLGTEVEPTTLLDPSVDLRRLVPGGR